MTDAPDLSAYGLILGELLGQGASGTVYEAQQTGVHNRIVAVKIFDPALFVADESLAREIESTKLLRHSNLLTVYDGHTTGDPRFLVLERAQPEPPSLPLRLQEMVVVGIKLSSALALAHQASIIHSDIKPDNVLWHGGEPLLSDFGTARIDAQTRYREDLGFTPMWSPPWIPGASADRDSDVWSLAASLIWLHWDWEPGRIEWSKMSPDLTEIFGAAMPSHPSDCSLGPEPALALGQLLQRCQHGRHWPVTDFPNATQENWSPTTASQSTLISGRPEGGVSPGTTIQVGLAGPPPPVTAFDNRGVAGPVANDTTVVRVGTERMSTQPTAAAGPAEPTRRRRWWAVVLAVALIGVAGVVASQLLADQQAKTGESEAGDTPGSASESTTNPSTASPSAAPNVSAAPGDEEATSPTTSGGTTPAANQATTTATGENAGIDPIQSVLVSASNRQGDLDIYRHLPDGTVELIVDRAVDDYAPSLSPDGSRVAFESNDGGTRAVYIAPTDGSTEPRQVSPSDSEAAEPAWSPSGDQLAWSSRAAGNWDIVVHDLDTGSDTVVVTGASDDRQANWSPDGGSLVFRSDRTGNGDIYRLRLADQSLLRVTDNPAVEGKPSISSDGAIAFERRIDSDTEVFSVAGDSNDQPVRRTNHLGFDGSPTFDQDRLVVVRRNGSNSSIVMLDGGREVELHTSAGLTQDIRIG